MCAMLPDGNYPSDKCSALYYTCSGGQVLNMQCQPGLIYDPDLDRCDVPENTKTCTGTLPTTSSIAPSAAPTTTAHPEFDCKKLKDGDYPSTKSKCENKYYTCSGGHTYIRYCAPGLFFDPEILMCESWSNSPSCSGTPLPSATAPTTHGPTTAPEFDCTGKKNGNYPSDKCSNKYYSCHAGFTSVMHCPPELFFDADRDVCEHYDNILGCAGSTKATVTQGPPTPGATLPPVKFDCMGKDDGYYASMGGEEHGKGKDEHWKPGCSDIYYSCTGGEARELRCPDGLVYSPSEGRCEKRDVAFECTGVSPTTTIAPPQGTFPTFPPVNFDCKGLANGRYPDPLNKCSHIFYVCSNGIATQVTCPAGTYFDVVDSECDYYAYVAACGGSKPASTTTPLPSATPPPEFDCLKQPDGVYPDPKTKCSNFFYVCSNGFTSKIHCPPGLWYDIDEKVCEAYGNIFACSGTTRAPTTTTSQLPGATTPVPAFDCKHKPDGHYPDPANKCQTFYYVCTNGHTIVQPCDAGLYYDVKLDTCERYIDILDCSGNTRPPTTTRAPTTAGPSAAPHPIDCKSKPDGDYADPKKECSGEFYTCSNGVSFLRHCPPETFFDPELMVCDTYANVPKCSGTPRPPSTTTVIPSAAPPTPVAFDCTGKPPGNYPAGECESHFYTCVGLIAFRQHCPPGTFYDKDENACHYKENVPSCGGVKPTSTIAPSESAPTTAPNYPVDCSKLPDGDVPDPTSPCSSIYYTCSGGRTYQKQCVAGLVYNAETNACDFRSRVEGCGNGPHPKPPHKPPQKPTHEPPHKPPQHPERPPQKPSHGNGLNVAINKEVAVNAPNGQPVDVQVSKQVSVNAPNGNGPVDVVDNKQILVNAGRGNYGGNGKWR